MRNAPRYAIPALAVFLLLCAAGAAQGASCFGTGFVSTGDGTLVRISSTAGTVVGAPLTLGTAGAQFAAVAVAPDGLRAYVTDSANHAVYAVDTTSFVVTARITTGVGDANALAISPDGTRVYVANQTARTITVVNTATDAAVGPAIAVPGADLTALSLSASGDKLYVARSNGTLYALSTIRDSLSLQTTIPIAGLANATALTPGADGESILVAVEDGSTLVISTASDAAVTPSPYATIAPNRPLAIAMAPDGSRVYLGTESASTVTTLGSGSALPVSLGTSDPVRSVAVTTDSRAVYALQSSAAIILSPRGDRVASVDLPTTAARSVAFCPYTVADAPTNTAATAGDGSASVTWVAPANSGGRPVLDYVVTAEPGGATCTATGVTACDFTGLANGTSYRFTVRARTEQGLGAAGVSSSPVTPQRVLGKLALTLRQPQVTVTQGGVIITTLVTATAAGTIAQTVNQRGKRRCSVSRRVLTAGDYQIRCVLNDAVRVLIRRARLSLTVRTTFSPANGAVAADSRSLVLLRRR